jgi:hypothetical protein
VTRTDWQVVHTSAAGLAPQGPNDPIQFFRVLRVDHTVIVDLSGLRLDTTKPGLANLGHLPDWACGAPLPHQYHWVNDSATSLHPSLCSLYYGKTIYWNQQVVKGLLAITRPETLRGGFEFTTLASFPKHLEV